MIDVFHGRRTKNAADLASLPLSYMDVGDQDVQYHDIEDENVVHDHKRLAIVGGGALTQPFPVGMRNVVEKHDMSVLWGVGLEFAANARSRYPLWFSKATLVGVRDWGPEVVHRWVPCASCMHEIFDDRVDPDVDFVIYNHKDVLAPVQDTEIVRANEFGLKKGIVPRMTDSPNQEMVDVVKFLARGRCVLTTSYYGAYWATLLGRNVIVWPWSSMFSYMRHRPAIVNRGSWTSYVADSRNYPDALMECRQANMAFRDEVRALVRSRDMMHETFVSS